MMTEKNAASRMKKIIAVTMMMLVAVAFMPMTSFASGKAASTTYQVYKKGKTVYCAGAKGIYKVKVKKGKVKSKKLIYKSYCSWKGSNVYGIKKHKKYIYFAQMTEGTLVYLYRVKTNGKNKKKLAAVNEFTGYAIKDGKLYYSFYDYDYDTDIEEKVTYVANLDGSKKHKTSVSVVQNWKETNKKGYGMKFKSVKKGKYIKDYLKTPKGKFYLGKVKNEFYY